MTYRVKQMRNGDLAAQGLSIEGDDAIIYAKAGDVRTIKWDLADSLDTSITISSVATSGSLSVGTPTISSAIVTFNATCPSGARYADLTATLSSGEKISLRLHAIESTPNMTRDYAA